MFDEDEIEDDDITSVDDGHAVALANSTMDIRKLLTAQNSPSKKEMTYKDKLTPDELDALYKAFGALGKLNALERNDVWRESIRVAGISAEEKRGRDELIEMRVTAADRITPEKIVALFKKYGCKLNIDDAEEKKDGNHHVSLIWETFETPSGDVANKAFIERIHLYQICKEAADDRAGQNILYVRVPNMISDTNDDINRLSKNVRNTFNGMIDYIGTTRIDCVSDSWKADRIAAQQKILNGSLNAIHRVIMKPECKGVENDFLCTMQVLAGATGNLVITFISMDEFEKFLDARITLVNRLKESFLPKIRNVINDTVERTAELLDEIAVASEHLADAYKSFDAGIQAACEAQRAIFGGLNDDVQLYRLKQKVSQNEYGKME